LSGRKKGVISFIEKKQPNVFMAGSCLHLVHIAAQKGAGCLTDIAEVLTDMYYYFQKSEKRQHDFSELQELYDMDQK